MFGISWPELLLIGIVAVIVIGPKDLPPLMRKAGQLARKGRLLWDEMRLHLDYLSQETGLSDMQHEADSIQRKTNARIMGDAEPPLPEPMTEEDALLRSSEAQLEKKKHG